MVNEIYVPEPSKSNQAYVCCWRVDLPSLPRPPTVLKKASPSETARLQLSRLRSRGHDGCISNLSLKPTHTRDGNLLTHTQIHKSLRLHTRANHCLHSQKDTETEAHIEMEAHTNIETDDALSDSSPTYCLDPDCPSYHKALSLPLFASSLQRSKVSTSGCVSTATSELSVKNSTTDMPLQGDTSGETDSTLSLNWKEDTNTIESTPMGERESPRTESTQTGEKTLSSWDAVDEFFADQNVNPNSETTERDTEKDRVLLARRKVSTEFSPSTESGREFPSTEISRAKRLASVRRPKHEIPEFTLTLPPHILRR